MSFRSLTVRLVLFLGLTAGAATLFTVPYLSIDNSEASTVAED